MSYNSWTDLYIRRPVYWISQDLVIKSTEQRHWHFTTFSSAAAGGLLSRLFKFDLSMIDEILCFSHINGGLGLMTTSLDQQQYEGQTGLTGIQFVLS